MTTLILCSALHPMTPDTTQGVSLAPQTQKQLHEQSHPPSDTPDWRRHFEDRCCAFDNEVHSETSAKQDTR
ncbi:hypothetical protein LSAT2_005266 [Lamellibrachia satsuma]|nr:hypothetical protein LSAT2_005266 [Lamellibrachia satsuma]